MTNLSAPVSQPSLTGFCPVQRAVGEMAESGIGHRGAIFTRREIVDFILDLVGYTSDKPLHTMRILEPSFGKGDFLIPVVQRLFKVYRRQKSRVKEDVVANLSDTLCAVELHKESFLGTRERLLSLLKDQGLSENQSLALANAWLIQGDFLLTSFPKPFTHVVGNPPYVRQERIPEALIEEYRKRFHTIFDRADIYIPFIEKSLSHLAEGGALGFICSDRWMKNRYGGPLRQVVADRFHLKAYVDMVDTQAFQSDVTAYPAITVIVNEKPGTTKVCHKPEIERMNLKNVARTLLSEKKPSLNSPVKSLENVVSGAEPWLLESSDLLALVRRLERDFPTIEEAGCKVGIGVATGADKAFIGPYDALDVEPDRKLPIAMTRDILTGEVKWRGYGIINPFADDASLVNLGNYPKLREYLEARRDKIAQRHVAQKSPTNWYRTIDRIYPELAQKPKLLIPDIKGEAHVVYENGQLYPHHNLYYILSEAWDLKTLRAVMLSGIAHLFISVYSTRVRGGYMRFQAQYLRRICLPRWGDVSAELKDKLITTAERDDRAECNNLIFGLYGFSKQERAILEGHSG